jgi:NTE family protein
MRGIAYAGAVSELETAGMLKGVKRFGGTSAGAITALLLALDYSAAEIEAVIGSTSFKKFNDGQFFFVGGTVRLRKHFGWYRGKRFEEWLATLVKNKTGNADITFAGLHEAGRKDLYVTGTCLNKQELVVFSHETYPHMRLRDAVRISMSIPLYFEAIFIDGAGKVIRRPKKKKGLDLMVDGGFIANFPIRMFDSTKYGSNSGPNIFDVNTRTVGVRIDTEEQIRNDLSGGGLAPMPTTNLKEYFGAFYNLVLENLNRQALTPEDWKRTVSIADGAIGPRIRSLRREEVNRLVGNGREAMRQYLERN